MSLVSMLRLEARLEAKMYFNVVTIAHMLNCGFECLNKNKCLRKNGGICFMFEGDFIFYQTGKKYQTGTHYF